MVLFPAWIFPACTTRSALCVSRRYGLLRALLLGCIELGSSDRACIEQRGCRGHCPGFCRRLRCQRPAPAAFIRIRRAIERARIYDPAQPVPATTLALRRGAPRAYGASHWVVESRQHATLPNRNRRCRRRPRSPASQSPQSIIPHRKPKVGGNKLGHSQRGYSGENRGFWTTGGCRTAFPGRLERASRPAAKTQRTRSKCYSLSRVRSQSTPPGRMLPRDA
jgi:hypothetical protein